MGDYYMSGGMKAFFIFSTLCDSLDMYGFMGSGNIDGHSTDSVHNFGLEHAWVHEIAKGKVEDSQFETPAVMSWLSSNGLAGPPHKKEELELLVHRKNELVEEIKDHLKCLAATGKIVVEGWTYGTPGAPPAPGPAPENASAAEVRQQWEPFTVVSDSV